MTALQNIDAQAEQKINQMMPFLMATASGDEDLIQEGAIALWETIQKAPDATDRYYQNKAKWTIIGNIRGVGKSVDVPKAYPRKWPISIVHYTPSLPTGGGYLWMNMSSRKWTSRASSTH